MILRLSSQLSLVSVGTRVTRLLMSISIREEAKKSGLWREVDFHLFIHIGIFFSFFRYFLFYFYFHFCFLFSNCLKKMIYSLLLFLFYLFITFFFSLYFYFI